jgi:xanthine dehydrogenase iron-sulfur cluster and FAD-binding subunit A
MLARGIRSYHRPGRLEQALTLAAEGGVPLAGGTRLLASDREVANVLDLSALELGGVDRRDGDLHIGATATLQDLVDQPLAHAATAGLLPAACRAHSGSRTLRSMATVGGEAVAAAPDSETVAALLALNAIVVVQRRGDEPVESPALRFFKKRPPGDLAGGGLVTSITLPGTPDGAALERVAVLPSAPSLVSVAVALSFTGDRLGRARIALTGLSGPPARVPAAEACLEGSAGEEAAFLAAAAEVQRSAFAADAHAPASYRQAVAGTLTVRALRRAAARARGEKMPEPPRRRPPASRRRVAELPYFTSGRLEVTVNGRSVSASVEARTTLLAFLRQEGFFGVKHGCETGECGACTVLLDSRPVVSCLTLALRAQGRQVVTVEGLGQPEALHPIQQAFVDTGAIQCGFCTPAMELLAKALLDAVPDPSEAEVRDALSGSLCRCTGYLKPVQAVLQAAAQVKGR